MNLLNYVTFNPASGEIDCIGYGPAEHWPQIQQDASEEGWQALPVEHQPGLNSYVDLATLTVKPRQDYSLDTLPLPCTLTIEGVQYPCEQQPELSFEQPGSYQISVDAGPAWLDKTFTIEQAD